MGGETTGVRETGERVERGARKRRAFWALSARGQMLAFQPAHAGRAGTRRRRASESARTREVETRRAARARAVVDGRREADAELGPLALSE